MTGQNIKLETDWYKWQANGCGWIKISTDGAECMELAFVQHDPESSEDEGNENCEEETPEVGEDDPDAEEKLKLLKKARNVVLHKFRLKVQSKLEAIDYDDHEDFKKKVLDEKQNLLDKIEEVFAIDRVMPTGDRVLLQQTSANIIQSQAQPERRASKRRRDLQT